MPRDLERFVHWLNGLDEAEGRGGVGVGQGTGEAIGWFDTDGPIHAARAPGRLDLMGGIADYSGSLVLQFPLAEAACCAVQLNDMGRFEALSVDAENDAARIVSAPIELLEATYDEARLYFESLGDGGQWGAYLFGPMQVLVQRGGVVRPRGVRVLLRSAVPEGKGVSSSAAIEVATMRAVADAMGLVVDGRDLACWCQEAENRVAGAPCGVMDQMASALGREHELLALRCQPAEVLGYHALPEQLAIWGIDSGLRHAVSGSDYGSVRVGAFAGYAYIARAAGMRIERAGAGRITIKDTRWGGYLANVTPSEFETHCREAVPEHVTGQALFEQFGGTCDAVVPIDPHATYAVRQPTAHPIHEHHRVRLFARLLREGNEDETARLLGELMYQSHASYSACGLGSDGTDELVERVRALGPERGLFGAKITGGGSGGTVAVLGRPDAETLVREIARAYARDTGRESRVFAGSSPGGAGVEVQRLRLKTGTGT